MNLSARSGKVNSFVLLIAQHNKNIKSTFTQSNKIYKQIVNAGNQKKSLPYEKFLVTYSPIKVAFKNNKLSGRKSGRSESTHTVAEL